MELFPWQLYSIVISMFHVVLNMHPPLLLPLVLLQGAIRLILVELFAGSCPMSRLMRLRGTLRELLDADVELVANVIAELDKDVAAAGVLDPCQVGAQLHLEEGNCLSLRGEGARVGAPRVDDGIVKWVVERMWGEDGRRAADAVLVVGGPPCQPHSDLKGGNPPSEGELRQSMDTVQAFCRIVGRIKEAAAATGVEPPVFQQQQQSRLIRGPNAGNSSSSSNGPMVFFVMENPWGRHWFSMRNCIDRTSSACCKLLAGLGAAMPTQHEWSEYATMPEKKTAVWSNVFTESCIGRHSKCYRASTVQDPVTGRYVERYGSAANGDKAKRQRLADYEPSDVAKVTEAYERSKWPDGFCLAVLKRVIRRARERWPYGASGTDV